MRTSNPALSDKAFQGIAASGDLAMTVNGTVNKTAIALILLLLSSGWTWGRVFAGTAPAGLMMLGFIGGFITALVTIFKRDWAPVTTPIYALFEGLALGGISALFEMRFPGIVIQAVSLTFATLFALLLAYRSNLIRATENFKLGVFAATGGICLVYLANFIMGFFGASIPFIHESGFLGIGFSFFVVVIAALNLVLDFDFIERGAERGLPKYMEWYGAFGLLVTLIWLYLEILRLLSKLQQRR